MIYSNTGAGTDIAESSRVTVSGNTIVDNRNRFSLRAMPGTANDLADVSFSGNSFAGWRQAGVATHGKVHQ